MKVTKTLLEEFRKDFAEAVKGLEKKYNSEIKLKNISYGFDSFTATVSVESPDTKKNEWNLYCNSYGLAPEDLGKTFKDSKHTYTIIGLKPNSRKYPIICKRDDGVNMDYTLPAVRQFLGK